MIYSRAGWPTHRAPKRLHQPPSGKIAYSCVHLTIPGTDRVHPARGIRRVHADVLPLNRCRRCKGTGSRTASLEKAALSGTVAIQHRDHNRPRSVETRLCSPAGTERDRPAESVNLTVPPNPQALSQCRVPFRDGIVFYSSRQSASASDNHHKFAGSRDGSI